MNRYCLTNSTRRFTAGPSSPSRRIAGSQESGVSIFPLRAQGVTFR
jgi:hypothetical protein